MGNNLDTRIPNSEKTRENTKLQESLDKREMIERIPKEEFFMMLKEMINITFYKNLHDNGMKDFEFIDFLKTKTNSEILDFLDDLSRNIGENYHIIKIREIINSREFLEQLHKIEKTKILAKTSHALGSSHDSQSEEMYIAAFRMAKFLRLETSWSGDFQTDFYQNDVHYSDTIENPDFQKFVENIEKIFGGEIGWNLSTMVDLYNNDTIAEKYFHTEAGLQLLKNGVKIIETNFGKNTFSLEEELFFVHKNISGNILKPDFEQKIQWSAEIFAKLENLWISWNHQKKLDFMMANYTRADLRWILELMNQNEHIFAIISTTPLAHNLQASDIYRLIQTENWFSSENKNDLENGRMIIEEYAWNRQTGYDLSRVFSLINADIRDATLLDSSLSQDQIFVNFRKFIASQSSVTTIETFLVAWKNFAKQKFSEKIISTKNADVEKIKLLFPRNNLMIGNNYSNLQDFIKENKTEELYHFLANAKNFSSANIDYIPTISEFQNSETVLGIIKNFVNISSKISLSDVFLVTHRSEMTAILLDTKTPEKLQNLAKLYGIDISDFANISQYEASSENIAGNITYKKEGFSYFLEKVLNEEFYNFLVSNVAQNKKFLNQTLKPDLFTLTRLYQYMSHEILVEENNFIANFEPKLAELGLDWFHIRSIGLYTLSDLNSVHDVKTLDDGKAILAYYMHKKPEQAHVIIDTAKLISDQIFIEKNPEKMLELLQFIAKISVGTDEYFDGNIDDLKNQIQNFAKLGVKISHSDELKIFFREAKFYKEFSEHIKNPEFITFYNQFSGKFFKNQKTMHSLVFAFEIFKNASKNGKILVKMKNWDFSDISRVVDFFKQKFSLNSSHPYFLASASHFMENFDETKNLLTELENQQININSNQIFLVKILADIFRENPAKKEIFLNIDKMRELITKEIYSRPEYARPKVENIEAQKRLIDDAENSHQDTSILEKRLREMQENYSERTSLSHLSLPDLWKIYFTYQWVENFDSQKLSHFIWTDTRTTTTEFGANMTFSYEDGKILSDFMPVPSFRENDDNSYSNNWYARNFIIGTNVHFHALNLNNGDYSGPSGWGSMDGGDYRAMQQTDDFSLVITPTRTTENGEIIINSDMYKLEGDFNIANPDYKKFRNVDLGIRVLGK